MFRYDYEITKMVLNPNGPAARASYRRRRWIEPHPSDGALRGSWGEWEDPIQVATAEGTRWFHEDRIECSAVNLIQKLRDRYDAEQAWTPWHYEHGL